MEDRTSDFILTYRDPDEEMHLPDEAGKGFK